MAIQDKKDEIKAPEKISPVEEQAVHFQQEGIKPIESIETATGDAIVEAELRREIDLLAENPATEKDAEIEREKIAYLGEAEKIEHLLQLAREKGGQAGVVLAVQIVKKMNEPYLTDLLHDSLSNGGFYKQFIK